MGQIVKRKKKGRPSKADLASRAHAGVNGSPAPESDIRRSRRRRNVKYNIDYDDYLDDFDDYDDDDNNVVDDEDDEDERRREKKLKLVLKQLPPTSVRGGGDSDSGRDLRRARDVNAREYEEEYGDRRTNSKMKMEGGGDDNDEDDDENDVGNGGGGDEEKGRQRESKGHDSVPGTPPDRTSGVPLPDKKNLELILDKLQKKDIYGVYAEPVDPEELPDYHEIIEHPMDFDTVRKKLSNGSYSTLEQLENDVYLICSNAMQYNAPDTIYYKQARTIQELARKKFLKVRIVVERSEKELKSEQKTISNSLAKKQIKRLVSRTSQEPVGSDFSSGATLATVGDVQNSLNVTQPGGGERPNNVDGFIEGNSSLVDNNLEKAEEVLSGKGLLSKFGRKPIVLDENRRTTYNISNQPTAKSDSIYTTLEGEHKQLVAVGLHSEYSYARSLARFAARLGPFAWKAASTRIEQALPEGVKFGRGWVGEYEPLPTPVLMIENHGQKESVFLKKLQCTAGLRTDDRTSKTLESPASGTTLEGKPSLFGSAGGPAIEGKLSFCGINGKRPSASVNIADQQHNPPSNNYAVPGNKVVKQVELNFPPTSNQNKANFVAEKSLSTSPKLAASRATEAVSRGMSLLHTVPVKKQNTNGAVSVGLPNGKVVSNRLDSNRLVSSSSDSVPNQMPRVGTYTPRGQEQSLSNSAQVMRTLAGKTQKQPTSSNNPPRDSSPVMPSVSSSRRNDSNNAAAAAARAWMSIGAGKSVTETSNPQRSQISADSLYNPARELHPQMLPFRGDFPVSRGMHFPSEQNSFPVQAFVPQPVRMANEAQFQNRPIVFPHLVTTDLSRFQVQTPWRGLSPHTQPRQKQDTLPPDLNISFQSSSSPVRQSAGVLIDSQQPDLALQL